MRTAAIVPAAGAGKRMGSSGGKQFLNLRGEPIIVHTLRALAQHAGIDEIYLVVPADKISACREELIDRYKLSKVAQVAAGGKQRQDSVAKGLACLEQGVDLVLVHDGVRPLVSQAVISRVIKAAKESGAAVAALPVKETIKEISTDGIVVKTLERSKLWAVQTPQVFGHELLKAAFAKAASEDFYGTDEAALVERLGHTVRVVEGNPENIKITTPEDLVVAGVLVK